MAVLLHERNHLSVLQANSVSTAGIQRSSMVADLYYCYVVIHCVSLLVQKLTLTHQG
jgi:hypothetical protein